MAIRLVGHAEAGLDIRGNRQAVQDYLEVPGVEEKDIQITLDNDVLMVRGEKRQNRRRRKVASTVWSAPTAAFSVP